MIEVPGDKSISHRYAILAALAQGRSEISRYSAAADCQSTLDCLQRLGIAVEKNGRDGAGRVAISGAGIEGLRQSRRPLDAGNSGTTMRLLAGVLAGQPFDSTLTGDSSLRRRPMRRVIEPLARMGAHIEARDANFAPLGIRGSALQPIEYSLPVASAQVKSAVLLSGPFCGRADIGGRARADTRSYRSGPAGVWRRRSPGWACGDRFRTAATRIAPTGGAGRPFVGGLLPGGSAHSSRLKSA